MKLVRVVAPHFVAGFETDGIVRRTAPILKRMLGWTDDDGKSLILDTTKPNKYESPD